MWYLLNLDSGTRWSLGLMCLTLNALLISSVLLFVPAVEPLSAALKSSPVLKVIICFGFERKVSLYADDFLLYFSYPGSSAHNVVPILEEFGSFSSYKLNFQKSEFLPINEPLR